MTFQNIFVDVYIWQLCWPRETRNMMFFLFHERCTGHYHPGMISVLLDRNI